MANRAAQLGLVEYGCQASKACGEDDALADRHPGLVAKAMKVKKANPEYTLLEVWAWAQLSQW